jgi:hypothetical protein
VVFKLDPKGKETILYNFTGGAAGNLTGYNPTLLRDRVGNLYGMTWGGGELGAPYFPDGCGVVYKIGPRKLDPTGKLTVPYSLCLHGRGR